MMSEANLQMQIPFLAEEYQQIIIPADRGIVQNNLSSWKAQKASMGVIRHDITAQLEKSADGFPIVKPYLGDFPKELTEIGKISGASYQTWMHGFSEDIVLDRMWKRPTYYLNKIPCGGGLIAPDFSVKLDMSTAEKQFNIFRRNTVAAIAQMENIPTIIPLTWAEYDSLDYCFSGIMPGGIYAISNVGTQNNVLSRKFFFVGLKEAIRVLEPRGLVIYGYPMEYRLSIPTRFYPNQNIQKRRSKR